MKLMNSLRILLASAMVLVSSAAFAGYPSKPITVVVGFSAGGSTDVLARKMAPYLEKYLPGDAQIVVKNVPGASGQIAVTEVAHAKPDGYTLGTYNLPGAMARTLDRDAHYAADSFTYLANVVNDPDVIVTPKSSSIKNIQQLVAQAKGDSAPVTVGVSSLGGDDQFALIALKDTAGGDYRIIPFRGSAPARSALMGGHVQAGMLNLSEAISFRDKLNILGVASKERAELAPDLPTFVEQDVDLVNGALRGFVAPAGLPEDVHAALLEAFKKAYNDPDFQKQMRDATYPVELALGKDFRQLNAQQLELAKKVWQTSPWR